MTCSPTRDCYWDLRLKAIDVHLYSYSMDVNCSSFVLVVYRCREDVIKSSNREILYAFPCSTGEYISFINISLKFFTLANMQTIYLHHQFSLNCL